MQLAANYALVPKMEIPSVRVLVVGDSGVGKTTLLQALCRDDKVTDANEPPPSHRWTTGCDVHVLLYAYRDTYGSEKETYVEFVDVGGHPKYEISRGVFYNDVQGVVFVHDLSNARSYDHLKIWLSELTTTQRAKGCVLPSHNRPGEYPTLQAMPKLIIGCKKDMILASAKRPTMLNEFRTVDSIEASAEPFAMDMNSFRVFIEHTIAFANRTNSSYGVDSSSNSSNYGPSSAPGLRHKPLAAQQLPPRSNSPSAMAGRPAGWWR